MKSRLGIGMKIASNEFQKFINDVRKYHISNIYLNKYDLESYNSKEYTGPIERFKTLKSRIIFIGNGIIFEFNNNIFYEFSIGFGVCDYHLKFSKPDEFPILENYINVKNTSLEILKHLINKNPRYIIPTFFCGEVTVLKGLEIGNYDNTKFSIIGYPFEFEDELGEYSFFDGAWILVDRKAIEKMKYK